MKKLVVASAAILAISTFSCAQSIPAAFEQAPAPPATQSAAPEQFLEEMRLSTMWSIEETITRGQNSPDYLYATLRDIEEAQKALQELDSLWRATLWSIEELITRGETVPEFQYVVLESVEAARHGLLKSVGLAE